MGHMRILILLLLSILFLQIFLFPLIFNINYKEPIKNFILVFIFLVH